MAQISKDTTIGELLNVFPGAAPMDVRPHRENPLQKQQWFMGSTQTCWQKRSTRQSQRLQNKQTKIRPDIWNPGRNFFA